MNISEEYNKRLVSAERAVMIVKNGDWVDYGQACSFPASLDIALAGRKDDLCNIKIRGGLATSPISVVENDVDQKTFLYNTWHFSGIDRKYHAQGLCYYNPMIFRNNSTYYKKGYAPVDVAMISVSKMDRNGYFSYGLTNCSTQAVCDGANHIILEVNNNMPFVYGLEADHIHISEVDYIVESSTSMPVLTNNPPTKIDRQIAAHILPYLYDGVTLQLGIGGIPNALGELISESDLRDLGMHTELMSNGYLALYKSGKLNNRRKKINRGKGIFSICYGAKELYDFVDSNIDILSAPMSYVNDPKVIQALDDFVSINGCITADIYGQICSESSGTVHISGTGGQLDFVTGACDADHGKSFLTMYSTHKDKNGITHSNIVPFFSKGDIITTPRSQAMYIVTEYGAVNIMGIPTWDRAEKLISIAHPDFREELIKSADKQRIWRRSNKR